MQNYNQQQQAVILKGIAQQVLQMNIPTFEQLNKLLKEFEYQLVSNITLDELSKIPMKPDSAFEIAKLTQKKTLKIVDPPEGWKYGFPKACPEYDSFKGNQLKNWIIKQGYPVKLIDSYGEFFHTGISEQPID